jgi:hypothetical protein
MPKSAHVDLIIKIAGRRHSPGSKSPTNFPGAGISSYFLKERI